MKRSDLGVPPEIRSPLVELLLALGDDRIVLGSRLAEWCGHAPTLEEDIALANIALDLIGQGEAFLSLAGEVEGRGRSADTLVYHREAIEYRNSLLVEQPRGDFGDTVARSILYDLFSVLFLQSVSESCSWEPLRALAEKSLKEVRYHFRHSSEWLVRLGQGTEESHRRVQAALEKMWRFTEELFEIEPYERVLAGLGVPANGGSLRAGWEGVLSDLLDRAALSKPSAEIFQASGGRRGLHTEHLGHLLAEMQILPRSYPDARW